MHRIARAALLTSAILAAAAPGFAQTWVRIFEDDFSTGAGWTYAGVQDGGGTDLIFVDGPNQRVDANWDQSNLILPGFPPADIVPSRLARPLGTTLTEADTFRFGAALRIAPATIPDTTEFHQIANLGLYNLTQMGPDRTLADFFGTTYRAGSDFVEFNYFVNNRSFGFNPNITATAGTHRDGLGYQGNYWVGDAGDPLWNSTDMGPDRYLPENASLFVEVVWYAELRRAFGAIYTDAARTQILQVNGVPMFYWTIPVPAGETFSLTDYAFFNYVGLNFGGANTTGSGDFDDVYVDILTRAADAVPEPGSLVLGLVGLLMLRVGAGRRGP